jgi:hypothetical protein
MKENEIQALQQIQPDVSPWWQDRRYDKLRKLDFANRSHLDYSERT